MEEDQNNWGSNTPVKHEQPEPYTKKSKPMAIVGYNLLALVGYTILFGLLADQGGFIFDALFLGCHVLVCLIMALSKKSWMWILSGVLVLAIGFSTCFMMIDGTGFK